MDWKQRLDLAHGSAWDALVAWEVEVDSALTPPDEYAVARKVQQNMADSAAARQRIRQTARDYDARGGAEGNARGGSDSDSERGYDTDVDVPYGATAPDVPHDGGCDAAEDMLAVPEQCGKNNKAYVEDMLGPLTNASADGLACRRACGPETRAVARGDAHDVREDISLGLAAAIEFDGAARLTDQRAAEARTADTPEVRAQLLAIARGQAAPLEAGDKVPYVRLTVTPTIAQTARLWTLNPKQAVAFAVLADVLKREVDGERVEPERMVITGEAGTGKSRVLQALQWYALQIGGVDAMAVVAYTWRAALLLGTPDNPACTTTTFFAIDSFACGDGGAHELRTTGKVRNLQSLMRAWPTRHAYAGLQDVTIAFTPLTVSRSL